MQEILELLKSRGVSCETSCGEIAYFKTMVVFTEKFLLILYESVKTKKIRFKFFDFETMKCLYYGVGKDRCVDFICNNT